MEENEVHGKGPDEYRNAFKRKLIPDQGTIEVERLDGTRFYNARDDYALEFMPGQRLPYDEVIGEDNHWRLLKTP